jgi:hypothetical protein
MSNSIVLENQLTGNPDTEWDLSGPGATNIQGFATDISINRDGTVNFKISTDSANYRIDIYRLGYYGGKGARKLATLQQNTASIQPAPIADPTIGLVDAGNWTVTASWAPSSGSWPATNGVPVSGVYIAHLVRQDATSGANHIPFIVRDDGAQHDIVFQTSDTTWHAYNGWGGYNLYGGGATASSEGRAYKLSYNRPIATRDGVGTYAGPQNSVFGVEIAAIHWLEANGYDVCYMAGVDTDRYGSGASSQFFDSTGKPNKKVFLSVGHDEYWSGPSSGPNQPNTGGQRANVEAARAAGVNLAFWSGNEAFWKTRYESSTVTTDGSPTAYRTLVCYKETRADMVIDPHDPSICTCSWRDPRFSPPGDAGRPENALTGTIFMVDDFREDQILIPYPMTKLRFWRNTPTVAATTPGNSGSLAKNYLGYEWDCSLDNGFRPGGHILLSSTTLSVNTYILDYGHTEVPAVATHNLTLYRDPTNGALVFGAGTVMWSWGLDADHDPHPKDPTPTPPDPNVKQATVNLLADMGVFAQTLQSGLVPATQSTDTTPPSSTITSPTSGASLMQNQTVTITGTASDAAGQVGGVEVSTDGGTTWHPATGTTSWSYNWTPATAGTVTIQARAADDSLNVEGMWPPGSPAGPSISVTVVAATAVSLFSGNDTPTTVTLNDPNPVELGVKFQSSRAGTITAIRFYKGPLNTRTHVGNLWSASGTLLATATFSGESTSGWQQVNFSSPVSILPNTIYVVSYHTNGEYSGDHDYFDTAAQTNGPLTAPATGNVAGGNGVYAYGSTSIFPINTFLGTNYWVDVVFIQTVTDKSFVTTENSTLTIPASQLLANDTDPNGFSLSVTGVSTPTTANGSATYNSSTQIATYTPPTNYTGPDSFTYIISNGHGGTYSANVFVTVNPPAVTTSSLFNASDTPATVTASDPNALELGVKFQSSVAGQITAIRFYKGPQNTGSHVGNLWSASGTLLASATFSGETTSGWQQVNLSSPVSITANTIYVVSYHTNQGFYSVNDNYFTSAHSNEPLTAPDTGSSGGNGVYAYGSTSSFPTNTYLGRNYWVDAVFTSSSSSVS